MAQVDAVLPGPAAQLVAAHEAAPPADDQVAACLAASGPGRVQGGRRPMVSCWLHAPGHLFFIVPRSTRNVETPYVAGHATELLEPCTPR